MDLETLASCVAGLGRDEGAVLQMHENAELLVALLAGILVELRQRNAASANDDQAGQFCQAVRTGWGARPFTSGELLRWALSSHSTDARTVLRAARAMCGLRDGADLTGQALGMRLATMANSEGAHLVRDGEARGAAVWRMRDLRD
jgi:hypothetical protein